MTFMAKPKIGAKLLCPPCKQMLDRFETYHASSDRWTGNDPPLVGEVRLVAVEHDAGEVTGKAWS